MAAPRFRFSLRTLFVLTTLLACWLGWQLHVVKERHRQLVWIEERGGIVTFNEPGSGFDAHVPFARGLLGDRPVNCINVNAGQLSDTELVNFRSYFPEALDLEVAPDSENKTGRFNPSPNGQSLPPPGWRAGQ